MNGLSGKPLTVVSAMVCRAKRYGTNRARVTKASNEPLCIAIRPYPIIDLVNLDESCRSSMETAASQSMAESVLCLLQLCFIGAVPFLRDQAWKPWISLNPQCHISVCGFGNSSVSRLNMFNNPTYGPYRGSVIELSKGPDDEPTVKLKAAFGDSYGIYYRYFEWPDKSVLYTLSVTLWYPLIGFAIAPFYWLVRSIKSHDSHNIAQDSK